MAIARRQSNERALLRRLSKYFTENRDVEIDSRWATAFFGMTRELQEHRETIRDLEKRVVELEGTIRLLAQEQRHSREIQSSEHEKLILKIQAELHQKPLPAPKKKKR